MGTILYDLKTPKTESFLVFLEGIEFKYWPDMGLTAIMKWFSTYEKSIRRTQFAQKSPTTRSCCSLCHLTENDMKC